MSQPSPGLAFLLEQAGLALADAQAQISSLTAEIQRLSQGTSADNLGVETP